MKKTIIIKKYSNRRLYHTEEKCYITLEQVAQIVRNGNEVKIIDNQSKKDITQETLLQILLESPNLFSASLLHDLIQLQEGNVQKFLEVYLKNGMDYFLQFRQQMTEQWNIWNKLWNSSIPVNISGFNNEPEPDRTAPPDDEKREEVKDNSPAEKKEEIKENDPQLQKLQQDLQEYKKKIYDLEQKLKDTISQKK